MNTQPEHQPEPLNLLAAQAGLPLITITTEDLQRSALVEAMDQIERGQVADAWTTLRDALAR